MDDELEISDADQDGASNIEENELQYHETAQQLCEKIEGRFRLFFFS